MLRCRGDSPWISCDENTKENKKHISNDKPHFVALMNAEKIASHPINDYLFIITIICLFFHSQIIIIIINNWLLETFQSPNNTQISAISIQSMNSQNHIYIQIHITLIECNWTFEKLLNKRADVHF